MLLKNAKIFTMTSEKPFSGDIRIKASKIRNVSSSLKPSGREKVFDMKGLNVYPGFIDAHTHLGVYSEPLIWANEDANECTEPVTPHLRAVDAVNLEDTAFEDAVKNGVTSVFTGPGSANVIGGQSLFIKTAGGNVVDSRVLLAVAGVKAALGENPKRVYGDRKKMPSTRMGTAALMRQYFVKALNYVEKKEKKSESFERNLIFEVLEKILKKEVPLRCHAHRFDDIVTIIRIRDEFDFNLVIEHATDGHKIADYIAEKKVPCVVGPTLTSKVKEELKDRDFKTLKILSEAGVLCAITTDSPVIPVQYLPLMAAYSVKAGLPRYEALKAITVNPASICGVVSRVGSIEAGKDADIAVFDGDPLLVETSCVMTIVDGKIVWNNL